MLESVDVGRQSIGDYEATAGREAAELADGRRRRGYLVDSVEECAERVLRLLRNPEEGEELALWGKEIVRERFLLTRLIADELELYASLLGVEQQRGTGAAPEVR